MHPIHIALGILIAAVWGFNFVMLHIGLQQVSPPMLCLARFFFASIPAVFFIKKPNVSFKTIALYGFLSFSAQFILLFIALDTGMPIGLASIVTQTHVFFTIFIAYFFLNERPNAWQIIGAIVAFGGIVLIGLHVTDEVSLLGLVLILGAALSWGFGNVVAKKIGKVNMLSLVVWSSLFAWPPVLLLALYTDGLGTIFYTFTHLSWTSIGAITYVVILSTLFGFALWNDLLTKYPAVMIAPFTLLVPIFGMLSGTLFLGESLAHWKLYAAALIISGLGINLLGQRLMLRMGRRSAIKVNETLEASEIV
ncbi:MAG TPA: EamA family transporter [Gammaproteobacteria bacterium]|nr:EamA family transporter [Gammaproteobacteria bacterium]